MFSDGIDSIPDSNSSWLLRPDSITLNPSWVRIVNHSG